MRTLTLLIFNIAALPDLLSESYPETNVAIISPLLNAYDVVLLQEDFWYQGELMSAVRHPFTSLPFTDEPRLHDIGDGLTQLSTFPYERFERFAWSTCYGVLDCGCDCLATKGFTFSVITLPGGLRAHLYNLHMDAGECAEDMLVRTEQLAQLEAVIESRSAGMPLIVAGDTNLEPGLVEDMESLDNFLARTGLREVGPQSIDRIMLRGPFQAAGWSRPAELDDLSDHQAVAVRLSY